MSRTLRTLCPGCGAQVEFKSGSSVLAVCPYCSSTLLRRGDSVENLGKMAELFEDHSPLQLGASGRVAGTGFALIGRLQYRYSQGTWNEWRLLDDNGESAWLSEDNGQYVLSRERGPVPAPAFDALVPEQQVEVDGAVWTVANVERAKVIAGAGELPFVVGAGYDAPVADLRNGSGGFATLDYSDATADAPAPRLYIGRAVALADLKMSGLREDFGKDVASDQFACPNCGAPVQVRLTDSKSIACPSCASVIDLSRGVGARVELFKQAAAPVPLLPVGSEGRLDGTMWTVVGVMTREGEVDGERFDWQEFLLWAPEAGFRFLVLDHGHWSLAKLLQKSVPTATDKTRRGIANFGGQRFHLFARYRATVKHVQGEFYWRVERGEITDNSEYVLPPRGLSRERTATEVTWSESRYVASQEIQAAFTLKAMPRAEGAGMLQPQVRSRWRLAYRLLFFVCLALVVGVQGYYWSRGNARELVASQRIEMGRSQPYDHLIEVKGSRPTNLVISTSSRVTNDAYDLDVSLVNQDTGETLGAEREVGFWEGRDSDGDYWSEGSRDERIVIPGVRPGRWLLRISAEMDDEAGNASGSGGASGGFAPNGFAGGSPFPGNAARRPDPGASYKVVQDSLPSWLTFLLSLPLLGLLYLLGARKAPDPEQARWRDSLYGKPPGSIASADLVALANLDFLKATALQSSPADKDDDDDE